MPEYVVLPAGEKRTVPKPQLDPYDPDSTYALPPNHHAALQSWLAARYRRSAFSDEFNARMKANRLDERLATILDRHGKVVTTMFFLVDDGKDIDRSDGSTYELAIILAYTPGENPEAAADIAERAAGEISDEFAKRLYDEKHNIWKDVYLKGCVPISEDELTVAKAKLLKERRAEHLTIRAPEKHAG